MMPLLPSIPRRAPQQQQPLVAPARASTCERPTSTKKEGSEKNKSPKDAAVVAAPGARAYVAACARRALGIAPVVVAKKVSAPPSASIVVAKKVSAAPAIIVVAEQQATKKCVYTAAEQQPLLLTKQQAAAAAKKNSERSALTGTAVTSPHNPPSPSPSNPLPLPS